MKYEKSCGAVVYRKNNGRLEYLIVQSKRDDHWGFAKGHVEEGENEIQTAKREVLEETNLVVELLEGFRETKEYYPKENLHKEVVFFIGKAQVYNIKIQEEEVEAYKFSTFEEVYSTITYDSDKDVLTKANEYLLNNRI